MIVLRFKVQCRPDAIEQASAAFAAVVPASRALDGVVEFDVTRDLIDPNTIVAVEVFEDADARERQEALPEVAAVMGMLPQLVAGPPEATIYEVTASSDAFAQA